AVQRGDLLAQQVAFGVGVGPGFAALVLVIGAHPVGRGLERVALRRGQRRQRGLPVGLGNFQRLGGGGRHAVEPLGVFQQGGIAPAAHVGQDAGGGAVDGLVLGGL